MPANLSPEYLAAEQRFKAAKTTPEKIEALEEMLSTIPKHKGTEKMQADLKRRLSKLRSEAEKRGGVARTLPIYHVEREGAGQVALVGAPNVGKSLLVRRLTHAQPKVAEYPFTTRLPTPGMMPFENVQFQLVDLPPVSDQFMESWVPTLVRQADVAALVWTSQPTTCWRKWKLPDSLWRSTRSGWARPLPTRCRPGWPSSALCWWATSWSWPARRGISPRCAN